jgi:cation diffusion facilitator CzcD-associated flavoprotein CzcO
VTERIQRIERSGIRTQDGRLHELDVIIYATGFQPKAVLPIEVTGARGQSLTEEWSQGGEGYMTVGVAGYPNFFLTLGPHSPGGNYSVIGISECQTNYIMQLIEAYRAGAYDEIDVKPEAQAEFNAAVYEQMKHTVWANGGCDSWYKDPRGIPILWPWTPRKFRRDLARPNWEDFKLRHVATKSTEPVPV